MTPATLLALLGTPLLWSATNADPPTICYAAACLTQGPRDLLLSEHTGDTVQITALHGPVADVARNLVVLRLVDAAALARDRAVRGLQERARMLAGG